MSDVKTVRNIFFVGSATEFSQNLEERFYDCHSTSYQYKFHYGSWDELFLFANNVLPSMIIVDFSAFKSRKISCNYLEYIINLKQSEKHKKMPIVGLFEDKDFLVKNHFVFNSGINYFHIIGDDFNLFFGNIFYMAFEDEDYLLKLAHAKKLQMKTKLYQHGYISEVEESKIRFEYDLDLPEEFEVVIEDLHAEKLIQMELLDSFHRSLKVPMLKSYETSFVLASGWETNDDALLEEDVQTWVKNLVDDKVFCSEPRIDFHFYSKKPGWLFQRIKNLDFNIYDLKVFSQFNSEEYTNDDVPDLIFYHMTDEHDLDVVDQLLTHFSNLRSKPILLLQGHPSSSAALQKMYGHDQLINTKEKVSLQHLKKIVELIQTRRERNESKKQMKFAQTNSSIKIFHEAVLTSLTENEVTFVSDIEIPYFTVMHFDIEEVHFSIIVVPSYFNLSPVVNKYHYHGIVCGITEFNRQILRSTVKAFINIKLTDWDHVKVDKDRHIISIEGQDLDEDLEEKDSTPVKEDKKLEKTVKTAEDTLASEKNLKIKSDVPTRKRVGDFKSKL